MSSWKKASKSNQKTHRERHQPEARKHLGLLEKKKDYKIRAADTHEKEKTLKLLHRRALNKNPDEFYHHMINSKIREDEHRENHEEDDHTKDQIALMQSQDIRYIAMKRTIEANRIKKLQSQLHMIDAANGIKNNHILFVDDENDIKCFDLASRFETHPALLGRKTNRPRMQDLEKIEVPEFTEQQLRSMAITKDNAYKELKNRIDREKELTIVHQKLEIKRALQQKRLLKPVRIKKGTKDSAAVYKFKYERKR